MPNAVIHQLKHGGKWRVVDVPSDWDETRDPYPDHESAKLHETEAEAIADWRQRVAPNLPAPDAE